MLRGISRLQDLISLRTRKFASFGLQLFRFGQFARRKEFGGSVGMFPALAAADLPCRATTASEATLRASRQATPERLNACNTSGCGG